MAVLCNPHSSSAEISALLDSWVTNTPSVKILSLKRKLLVLIFSYKHNMLKCWSVQDQSGFGFVSPVKLIVSGLTLIVLMWRIG